MVFYFLVIFFAAGAFGVLGYCAAAGFRNGDRPGDARVSALLAAGAGPVGTGPAGTGPAGAGRAGIGPAGAGRRAAGPLDARPACAGPLIVATVRNPSGTPVLAALQVRRGLLPAWLAGQAGIRVPRWTKGRKFRPGAYATVGIVAAGGAAEFPVPVQERAHRYLLSVAVGQEGGRLRVHRLRPAGADIFLGSARCARPWHDGRTARRVALL